MRLLVLTRFDQLGASSRLRMLQYLPWFESDGMQVEHHALLSDRYVEALYGKRRVPFVVAKGYLGRLATLLRARRFDAVFLEKEALPWIPAAVERFLLLERVPVIVDLDDAQFHRYDSHGNRLIRKILGSKIDHVMARSVLVTAGNDYIRARAIDAGCRRVEVVPTVIDLRRYGDELRSHALTRGVTIGWVGSPATASYLHGISNSLKRIAARHSVRCVAIGARDDQVRGTPFVALPWKERLEVEMLRSLDIGIMPIPDGPWERGKCGYKLVQYMACGVPVVASAVGANMEIVNEGESGFLVRSDDQWDAALEHLIVDPAARTKMGLAGRRRVEKEFCVQVQGPRLTELLRGVCRG